MSNVTSTGIAAVIAAGLTLHSAPSWSFDPIMIGDSSLQISGFIKGDAVYSTSKALVYAGDQLLIPGTIPLDGDVGADTEIFSMHARESRLKIATITPLADVTLQTRLEMDAFGVSGTEATSNSHDFRLRVAWAQLGRWGGGQDWSSWVIFSSVPEQNNFGALIGNTSPLRQAAFRYAHGPWVISLENPETTLDNGAVGTGVDTMPDLMVRYNLKYGAVDGALAVVGRQLTDTTGNETDFGTGITAGGRLTLGSRDALKALLSYGAIGRYMSGALIADAESTPDGGIQAIAVLACNLGLEHRWSTRFRSVLQYGWTEADMDFGTAATTESGDSLMLSHFWNPYPQTRLGVDLSRSTRETQGGESGAVDRVQFSLTQQF